MKSNDLEDVSIDLAWREKSLTCSIGIDGVVIRIVSRLFLTINREEHIHGV
jgi:hypothetical protein